MGQFRIIQHDNKKKFRIRSFVYVKKNAKRENWLHWFTKTEIISPDLFPGNQKKLEPFRLKRNC